MPFTSKEGRPTAGFLDDVSPTGVGWTIFCIAPDPYIIRIEPLKMNCIGPQNLPSTFLTLPTARREYMTFIALGAGDFLDACGPVALG